MLERIYVQGLSAVARARYESNVLQAGLGNGFYSIDYPNPAVLYFAADGIGDNLT